MPVYFIRNEVTRNVKIGHAKDADYRLRLLQQGNDCRLTLVATIPGDVSLETQFHTQWHEYRLYDEGSAGQEWFSIDVEPDGKGGVKITGREKQRPPKRGKKEKRRNQLCLRLSDRQLELLRRYVSIRHFSSEVEAIRYMIDGLEDWLARQASKRDIAGSPGPPPPTSVRSDVEGSDVPGSDVRRPSQGLDETEGDDDSPDSAVGDFGGRPAIGLPKPSWNDGMGD